MIVFKPLFLFLSFLSLSLLVTSTAAQADEVDAYYRAVRSHYVHVLMHVGSSEGAKPLCTLGLDCAPPFMSEAALARLHSVFEVGASITEAAVFRAVLDSALSHPGLADVNVALVIPNHHENVLLSGALGAGVGTGGGTFLRGYRKPAQARRDISTVLNSIPATGGAFSHAFQPRESFLEWLRYIRGEEVALGTNTLGNFGSDSPVPDYDESIMQGGVYVRGVPKQAICPRMSTLVLALTPESFDHDLDSQVEDEFGEQAASSFDGMLRSLSSHSFDLLPDHSQRVVLNDALIVGAQRNSENTSALAAAAGSLPLYLDDPLVFEEALTQWLVSAVTKPPVVSRLVFGPNLDTENGPHRDVFVAQTEVGSGIAWRGNIKKLRLKNLDGHDEPQIVDANNEPALVETTTQNSGIRFGALSLWSDAGELAEGDGDHVPKMADGGFVARGGAGQQIDLGRTVYTESPDDSRLIHLDANIATAALLRDWLSPSGQLSTDELVSLIRWVRGEESAVTDGLGLEDRVENESIVLRDWVLGEVHSSTPIVLNYGAVAGYSSENPNIRIFYGSGDGAFHAVENTTSLGAESGEERFAFYPLESLNAQLALRENTASAAHKRHGVGGATQLLVRDINGDGNLEASEGDKAIVYFGMRRGGYSYYALDVSDPDGPPRLLWKIAPDTHEDFRHLGLTFSTPAVLKLELNGSVVDALAFGGGYNGGWAPDYAERLGKDLSPADDLKGNALFIVDALSGKLIWKAVKGITGERSVNRYEHAALVDSVAAPPVPLLDAQGLATRLYFGDTGGGVWRVDLRGSKAAADRSDPSGWMITKLADLGSDALESGGSAEDDRRFFQAVDIVRSVDSFGPFDGVLIASGDTAHPKALQPQDYLFYIKDRYVDAGSAAVRAENDIARPLGRFTTDDLPSAAQCPESAAPGDELDGFCHADSTLFGWKLALSGPGEKAASPPVLDGGRIFFSTYLPGNVTPCSGDIGSGRLYAVGLKRAQPVAGSTRFYDLGSGIPDAVQALDDMLFVPGPSIDPSILLPGATGQGGAEQTDAVRRTHFIPSRAKPLVDLYWTESGIDS
ncbi:MAG: pilus assembly protein [Halioglobus sp.]